MARFEKEEGEKKTFFEIEIDDATVTSKWGPVGAPPTTSVKKLASADEAQKLYDKQVKERVKRGFVMVGLPPPAALDAKQLATHLKTIEKDPASEAGYLVLADWLQSVDHPWGQLITVQHAESKEAGAKKKKDLAAEAARLLAADAAGVRTLEGASFTWRWGFVETASLRASTGAAMLKALKTFGKLPVARTTTALVLDLQPASLTAGRSWAAVGQDTNVIDEWAGALKGLPGALPKTVKRVSLGSSPPVAGTGYARLPDLALVSAALGEVPEVEIAGYPPAKSKPLDLPAATSVEVRYAEANDAGIDAIVKAKLPKATRLHVWFGGTAHCCLDDVHSPTENVRGEDDEDDDDFEYWTYPDSYSPDDLEQMNVYSSSTRGMAERMTRLLGAKLPGVKDLGLRSVEINQEMAQAILGSAAVARMERLDLSDGELIDEAAKMLIKSHKKLEHLKELDLRRMKISDDQRKALKKAFPNALLDQSDARHPLFLMRYVATVE
jgi:predicted DNA-binding WGR domain protein